MDYPRSQIVNARIHNDHENIFFLFSCVTYYIKQETHVPTTTIYMVVKLYHPLYSISP